MNTSTLTFKQNDQIEVILESLELIADTAAFFESLLSLASQSDNYKLPFFNDGKNTRGFSPVIASFLSDIDHVSQCISDLDVDLKDKAEIKYKIDLAYEQINLLSRWLRQQRGQKESACGLRSVSSFRMIFADVCSRARSLHGHFLAFQHFNGIENTDSLISEGGALAENT